MISAVLIADNPNHFYHWLDGVNYQGVNFRFAIEGSNVGNYDIIISYKNFIKPHIFWFDNNSLPESKKQKVFYTEPEFAINAKKLGVNAAVQPYYFPEREHNKDTILHFNDIDAIKKELHWEKFKKFDKNCLENTKLIVGSIEDRYISSLCTAWRIPIVNEKDVKMAIRDINRKENADALRRAGMRYQNLSPIVGEIKNVVKKKSKNSTSFYQVQQDAQKSSIERRQQEMVRHIKHQETSSPPQNISLPALSKKEYRIPVSTIMQTPAWFHQDHPVEVSVIVPLFRSQDVIEEHIRSWEFSPHDPSFEIIYVNDACPHNSFQKIIPAWNKSRSVGKIISLDHNSGFASACNIGSNYARGEFLIFLNADTIVTKNFLSPMIDILRDTDIGIVGNLQLKMGDYIDSAGSEWTKDSRSFEHIGRNVYQGKRLRGLTNLQNAPRDMLEDGEREMVTGCCVGLRKEFFDELCGFDIAYRYGYWEDADLCMRIRQKGKKVYFTSKSKIYHKGGHSRSNTHPYMLENAKLFYRRWVRDGDINLENA